jgi:beta-glucanase (GH16 family)
MKNPSTRNRKTSSTRLAAVTTALTLIIGLALTALAPTPSHAAAPPGYQLSWFDEFDTVGVDTTKWNHRTDTKGWSQQRPENVSVGGGLMTIHLCPEATSGPTCQPTSATTLYTGGGLISKQRLRYGYYETRVRTNVGAGWHTAFWSAQQGGTSPQTEIDGFEIDSHQPHLTLHNVIPWGQHATISSGLQDVGFDSSAAFHVYGFEWLEDKISFFVDGQLIWSTPYPQADFVHNFLNLWLTTIAIDLQGSPGVEDGALPGKVQFDYVRYYQRDGYGDNNTPTGGYAESGTGWSTSTLPAFGRLTSRYSCDAGTSAHWTVTPPATGNYRASFYRIGGTGGQVNAPVTVLDGGTTLASAPVDLSVAGNGWVPVGGVLPLTGGHPYTIKITRTGAGCIRADAVKFVRQ